MFLLSTHAFSTSDRIGPVPIIFTFFFVFEKVVSNTRIPFSSERRPTNKNSSLLFKPTPISITKFGDFFKKFTTNNNEYVGLIKPQFELSKEKIGKNGVVKNSQYRHEAVGNVSLFLKNFYNFVSKTIESPIKGSKGNTEYLIYCRNS